MVTDARRQAAGLVEAGLALAAELDLDALLQRIADVAREVVGADYAAVGVTREDGLLSRFVYSGIDEEMAHLIGDLPRGRGVLGQLIVNGQPLRLREISQHPRSSGFPPNHPPMHSFLGVPIVVRSRIFGRLYLTEKQGDREFSKDDERIAMTLAAQAGVAIDNARLLEEVRDRGEELAVLEERDRISKELHDGVIQSIFSVGLSLQGAMGLLQRDPDATAKRMDEAIATLDDVVRDVRSYIFALQPKSMEEHGLKRAVEELGRDLEVNALVHAELRMDDRAVAAVPPSGKGELIQAIREIFSNIARHAAAKEVSLECSLSDGRIVITIEDDGVGFDPSQVTRGHGLSNIEARAEELGGDFQVRARLPRGTIQVLTFPEGGGRD